MRPRRSTTSYSTPNKPIPKVTTRSSDRVKRKKVTSTNNDQNQTPTTDANSINRRLSTRTKRRTKRLLSTSDSESSSKSSPKENSTVKHVDEETVEPSKIDTPVHPTPGGTVWRFNALGIPQCPLPCREAQFEEIWTFVRDNVEQRTSRCMYVSGVPGTGKTVIVNSVVNKFDRYVKERNKDHLKFNHVYINGLTLGSPDKIWKRFCVGLFGEANATTSTALKKLKSFFESSNRLPVVLVIDELDQILDRKQAILYQLLEWSSHPETMFSLIAIFNTMSLPESGLVMRNASRMSLARCIFPPYTHDQLRTIILNSIEACKSEKLKDEALGLLSKKVAAVSGDARRALELARRAIEIVESGEATGVLAVNGAFKEIFSSIKINTMRDLSLLEQSILKTLAYELHNTGNEETTLLSIYETICGKSLLEGHDWTSTQFMLSTYKLASMKLVIIEQNGQRFSKRVTLNIPFEDVKFALEIKD